MLQDWLQCPYCGEDADLDWDGDHEHIIVTCNRCESSDKHYHGEFSDEYIDPR